MKTLVQEFKSIAEKYKSVQAYMYASSSFFFRGLLSPFFLRFISSPGLSSLARASFYTSARYGSTLGGLTMLARSFLSSTSIRSYDALRCFISVQKILSLMIARRSIAKWRYTIKVIVRSWLWNILGLTSHVIWNLKKEMQANDWGIHDVWLCDIIWLRDIIWRNKCKSKTKM